MREATEIQRAHDLLKSLLFNDIAIGQSPRDLDLAKPMLAVLCWVLEHESGGGVHETLAEIENRALAAGYRIVATATAQEMKE